jgi:heme/copper-type cytochrome/quinol oxidase subunit 4
MHKYGVSLFIGGIVAVILAVVAFVMVMLTSPNWRLRP